MADVAGDLVIEVTTDSSLLAEIHFTTTSIAYERFFSSDAVHPTVHELALMWDHRLDDEGACALAAFRDGEPVGSVAVRRDPDFDGEGQLLGLHVVPDHWGNGFGSELHDAALNLLRSGAYANAGLWVIADNTRARRMYVRRGWRLRQGVELDYLGVRELRYARAL